MKTLASSTVLEEFIGYLFFATCVIALGCWLFGYNITVIAGAILFIKNQYALSPLLEESVVAAVVVGAAVGGQSELERWMSIGGVILLAGTWSIRPASVTFLIISELYPQHVRGPAMSIATVAIWLSFLVMTFTFLTTVEWLGESLTFWAYGIMCIVATAVVYRYVPYLRDKSIDRAVRGQVNHQNRIFRSFTGLF